MEPGENNVLVTGGKYGSFILTYTEFEVKARYSSGRVHHGTGSPSVDGQWCWNTRTKIHQQMTPLKAWGERLYIKSGKDLMTKIWVMLVFIKRRK